MVERGKKPEEADEAAAIRERVESLLKAECQLGFEVSVTLTKRLRAVNYLGVTVRIDGRLGGDIIVKELLAKISSVAGICEWRGDLLRITETGRD